MAISYTDKSGIRSLYSWCLAQTDKVPKYKATELCLRELEQKIERDKQNGRQP